MSSPDTMSPAADRPRFGLRFSLLTLFVLAIVLSLVIANLITSFHVQRSQEVIAEKEAEIEAKQKEIEAQQAEIERYQDQLGILRVKDHSKTHIIAMETFEDTVWRWRVYVPAGEKYKIKALLGDIPNDGFPENAPFTSSLDAGESRLTISIKRGADGAWKLMMERLNGPATHTTTTTLASERMAWYARSGSSSTSDLGPNDGQRSYMPYDPIQLVRHRAWAQQESGQGPDMSKPSDGVLLWLDPVQKSEDPGS